MQDEKRAQDAEFSKLRASLDEKATLIRNQQQLLNKLQVLNEVTQSAITQSSQDLANKTREKQQLSLQINDKTREQEKLKQRYNYLQNEIKNCIPTITEKDGSMSKKYRPEAVTILPNKHRKFNVPSGTYEDVNVCPVRSKNAIFGVEKNAVDYDNVKADER